MRGQKKNRFNKGNSVTGEEKRFKPAMTSALTEPRETVWEGTRLKLAINAALTQAPNDVKGS